jgi:hypothetical protein
LIPELGGNWLVGGQEWAENPRIIVQAGWHEFVRLWGTCRGDAGIAHWPDAGGIGDQAAWVIDAFGLLESLNAEMSKAERSQ